MRRSPIFLLAIVGLVAVWLMPVDRAAADASLTRTSEQWGVHGDDWQGGDEWNHWSVDWSSDSIWGDYGNAVVDLNLPSVGYLFGHGEVAVFEPDALSVPVTWWTDEGGEEPLGEGVLTVSLTLVGEPEPFEEAYQDGNQKWRSSGTRQLLAASAQVTLPDGTLLDLIDGEGENVLSETWETNPRSSVFHSSYSTVYCQLTVEGYWGWLHAEERPDSSLPKGAAFWALDLIQGEPPGPDGEPPPWVPPMYSGWTETDSPALFHDGTVEIPLSDGETGNEAGIGLVEVAFSPGDVLDWIEVTQYSTMRVKIHTHDVTGHVTFPNGVEFDLASAQCEAFEQKTHWIAPGSAGPQQRGPIPSNDEPAGAEALRVETTVNDHTRMASFDAEEPMWATDFDWPEPVATAHTLWYLFEGTGQTVVISMEGSDFNTAVGIYVDNGDGLVQIAGRDNHWSFEHMYLTGTPLQAKVMLDTDVGVTYYIQIGSGNACTPEYGRLRINILETSPTN